MEKEAIILIGGARGWDWEVMDFSRKMGAKYKLYLPFMTRLDDIPSSFIDNALEVWYAFAEYNVRGYQIRNKEMVDDSRLGHSYWDGRKCWVEKGKRKCSGTWNCIEYAISQGIRVKNWYNLKLKTGFEHF